MHLTEEKIIGMLKENVCNVQFRKVDGSLRKMRCTLHPDLIPLKVIVEGKKERAKINDVVAVWDLDLNEWRSFKVSSVLQLSKKSN